jgi:asparagine synthase (glutamine-hydrolysing)
MCGFLGQINANDIVDKNKFKSALEFISHRGPDASNIMSLSGHAYFGHHRLAILDLDEASNQPFESLCGNFTLVYNGEIYNYIELRKYLVGLGAHFRTKSDTEVLLQGLIYFGTDFLQKLEGMFSFGFIDKNKKLLICGRDAFGIKPLYYDRSEGGLVFSSEIPPIRCLTGQGQVNQRALTDFLLDGSYDHSNETFFSGIKSLGAGEYFNYRLDTRECQIYKWFSYEDTSKSTSNYDAIVLQTREILIDSVHKHLRADVPISLALSGGLDSSGVTGIVRHLLPSAEIQTFSYVPEDVSISEENWIDLAASHNHVKSNKVKFQQSKGIDDLIATVKAHQEPFGSSSMIAQYIIFKSIKAFGIKVTLDGQGADELFCGYTGYLSSTIISLVRQKRFGKLAKILKMAIGDKGIKFVLRAISMSGIQILPYEVTNIIARHLHSKSLLSCFDTDPCIGRMTSIPSLRMGSKQLRQSLNFATFENGLPSLLRHADRSSMAHSIESRVPYLHAPLFKYINTIPNEFLFGNQNRPKGLLFDVLEPFIPEALYCRKDKVGFFADEWLILNQNTSDILDHFDSRLNLPNINVLKAKELVYKASKNKDVYQSHHWRLVVAVLWSSYCTDIKSS